ISTPCEETAGPAPPAGERSERRPSEKRKFGLLREETETARCPAPATGEWRGQSLKDSPPPPNMWPRNTHMSSLRGCPSPTTRRKRPLNRRFTPPPQRFLTKTCSLVKATGLLT